MNRPNLLVIHTDQQSSWTLSCYDDSLVSTPHADRLAAEGARFTQFFTNSAVCTPSRGCFVTGRYPHCHGAYRNNIPLGRDQTTFAHVLQQTGYDTGYAGKWHLDGTPRPGWTHPERSMGFADARYMFNRGHWKRIDDPPMPQMEPVVHHYREIGDEHSFTTDWLAQKTIDFIQQPRDNPFCYMVSIPDPHTPFTVRPPYDSMYDPQQMPIPDSYYQEDLPDWAVDARTGPTGAPNEQALRRHKAQYCGQVKLIDACVGRILTALEERDILDDTIVVFTTDHGEYMGEHGLMAKNLLYETAYRIPLLIRWPEKIPPGTVVDHIASTVDFQPSILELMGVPACGREQGRDISAVLCGEDEEWIDEAFIHHASLERAGIFTPEFELAYVKGRDAILFDRENDPDQLRNLFGDPNYADAVVDLTRRIVDHNAALDSPAISWLREIG